MHISDLVAAALFDQDFVLRGIDIKGDEFQKTIENFAPAGQLSNGNRLVRIRMDSTGRWLERVDGWGKVQKDVDLRNYPDQPLQAIEAVLN